MTTRDPRWENVHASFGWRITNDAEGIDLTQLRELLVEVVCGDWLVYSRQLINPEVVDQCDVDLFRVILDHMVGRIDEELDKKN